MLSTRGSLPPMLLITAVYVVLVLLFVVRVPDWQTPDEPAHYSYIAQIAEGGRLPVIESGDWDSAALERYKSNRFADVTEPEIRAISYEDHQPPLYYVLAAPVYSLTDGSLAALRTFSALWGVVIIWSAFGVALVMLPRRPWVAVAAAGFVAFQPMHLHILASVNNDALAWAIVAVGLLGSTAYVKGVAILGWQVKPWMLGLLVGIGLFTKATTYFMAGVVGLAIVIRWWLDYRRQVRTVSQESFPEEARTEALTPPVGLLARVVIAFLLPALILGGVWWLRNVSVYGFPDFMGLAAHDAVVADQPRTAERIELLGWGGYLEEITRVTFNSFWGQFGWMAVPLQTTWYNVIGAVLAVLLLGLGVDTFYLRRVEPPPLSHPGWRAQRAAWGLLILTAVLSILAYIYYNTEFQQYQGRYTFTMLVPFGLWLALGVDGWRRLLLRLLGPSHTTVTHPIRDEEIEGLAPPSEPPYKPTIVFRMSTYVTALSAFPLAAADLYLIWRVIPPSL